jgi:molecular chaperone DnaK (HSP70)
MTRYLIGIDLGTTNTALAYADTGSGEEAALCPSGCTARWKLKFNVRQEGR